MTFSIEQIDDLRELVRDEMSEYRFVHTSEVEKMAVRLGELFAPDKEDILRVCALLHDITKEKSKDEQLDMLAQYNEPISELDVNSPKTLHAKTAALLIANSEKYRDFACPEVISAVRHHTVGSADMGICDMLVYLADYIDMSRKFDDCVVLRDYFWDKNPEQMNEKDRYEHLLRTLVLSFDLTLEALIKEGNPISPESVAARNRFICILNRT